MPEKYVIDGVDGYSPMSFLSAVRTVVTKVLKENRQIKVKMVLNCTMARTNLTTGEVIYGPALFASKIHENLEGTDINGLYNTMVGRILENLATFQSRGSNWAFMPITALEIHTVEYKPLRGHGLFPLPPGLVGKKAIINMKNSDDECFKWRITRALNPVKSLAFGPCYFFSQTESLFTGY